MDKEARKFIFARKLRWMRGETSQRQVSEQTGLDRSTLIRYEQGKVNPALDYLWRLADYFKCSIDTLVGREHSDEQDFVHRDREQ